MRSWNQVKTNRYFLEQAIQSPEEALRIRQDFLHYKARLFQLIDSINSAKKKFDAGDSADIILENLFTELEEIKRHLPK